MSLTNEEQEPATIRNGPGDQQATSPTSGSVGVATLGWTEQLEEAFGPFAQGGFSPARVVGQHRGSYSVICEAGQFNAHPSGHLKHTAMGGGDLPAVGDWVGIALESGRAATIHAVLPRSSKFSRKVAGVEAGEQVIAANIDVAFVLSSLDRDFNLRRLERYVAVAYGSGATPVVVLTKSDLCEDVAAKRTSVEKIAPGVSVIAVSNVTGEGVDDVRAHLGPATTAVMLGSSGVGKSTLVNRLRGDESQRVAAVRNDRKGRHTTTSRELLVVPSGGVIIDTPGMRELQLWDANEGLTVAFGDIELLAANCKFSDCGHDSEPGCAVKAAVSSGELDVERLRSYEKLLRELRALEIRRDARAKAEDRRGRKKFTRQVRAITKSSPKSR